MCVHTYVRVSVRLCPCVCTCIRVYVSPDNTKTTEFFRTPKDLSSCTSLMNLGLGSLPGSGSPSSPGRTVTDERGRRGRPVRRPSRTPRGPRVSPTNTHHGWFWTSSPRGSTVRTGSLSSPSFSHPEWDPGGRSGLGTSRTSEDVVTPLPLGSFLPVTWRVVGSFLFLHAHKLDLFFFFFVILLSRVWS